MTSADAPRYSEECSAFGFYGFKASADVFESFYQVILSFFEELKLPPSNIGVMRSNPRPQMTDFTRGNARLLKMGFDGVKLISIVSSVPNARIISDEYLLSACCHNLSTPLAHFSGRSTLEGVNPHNLLSLALKYISILKPQYGIGFQMLHRFGPTSYIGGVGSIVPSVLGRELTDDEKLEAKNIGHWGTGGMYARVWERGIIRDVYPWNFFTEPHLKNIIQGVTLEAWIRQNARRGKLSLLTDGVYFWEVDKTYIASVRQELSQAGLVFDWKKHL